jgi:hypothetical protein
VFSPGSDCRLSERDRNQRPNADRRTHQRAYQRQALQLVVSDFRFHRVSPTFALVPRLAGEWLCPLSAEVLFGYVGSNLGPISAAGKSRVQNFCTKSTAYSTPASRLSGPPASNAFPGVSAFITGGNDGIDVHGTVAPALTQIASTANIAVNANSALAKPRNREIDQNGIHAGARAGAACKPHFVKKVKSGKHTFRVEAIDAAGDAAKTLAIFKWQVLNS